MYSYSDIFLTKQKILFVTAHPDDSVAYFGALIHHLCQDKKEVYVLLGTNGARGSRDNTVSEEELSQKRFAEEAAALAVLGVPSENLFSLGYPDGEMESTMKLIGEVSKYIRKFKVDLVATHDPSLQYAADYAKTGSFIQHRDHRKIGEATLDAVYPFSRDRSFFTDHYLEGIEPHEVFDVLLTDEKESNFDFDYTETVEIKKKALAAHQSQFDQKVCQEIVDFNKFDDKYIEKFNYLKLLW